MPEQTRANADRDRLRARRRAYSGISLGTIFICIGTVLLLNNLGRLSWGIWFELVKLWPLLLISIGIRMAFAGTWFHPLSLAGPAIVALATIWVVSTYRERTQLEMGEIQLAEAIPLDCPAQPGGQPARLDLEFAAGRLRLISEPAGPTRADPAAAAPVASTSPRQAPGFHGLLRYQGRKPRRACSGAGDLRLGRIGSDDGIHFVLPFGQSRRRWEARLAADSPIDLNVDLAAAAAELDLRSFIVKDLDLQAAASSITIRLGPPRSRVPVRIDGAVSSLRLLVPDGTCFTVARERVLNILDADGIRKPGRRARRVTAEACGPGETAGGDLPRYEISYELPLSTVSVETETAGV